MHVSKLSVQDFLCAAQRARDSSHYVFWVPLAWQQQAGVCAGFLKLHLRAKQLLQRDLSAYSLAYLILHKSSTRLPGTAFGCFFWVSLWLPSAFRFGRGEHVQCDLQPVCKTCSLNKFSWKSLHKHLGRMRSKKHKPMCGVFSPSINWSSP